MTYASVKAGTRKCALSMFPEAMRIMMLLQQLKGGGSDPGFVGSSKAIYFPLWDTDAI